MKSKILTIVVLLTFGSLVTAKTDPVPSKDLIVSGSIDSPITPSAISNHDFEVAEGFATGVLSGQNGWTAFAASTVMPTVAATNPSLGAQHMHLENDPANGGFTNIGGFSPDLGPQSTTEISEVSIDVFISAGGGSDYWVAAQAPSVGFLTWRVNFDWLGGITVLDDIGGGLAEIDTGVTWPVGTYFNILVVSNPVTDVIDYYLDGSLIYTSVAGHFGALGVEQVVIYNDNFQNAGDTAEFDNLKINTQLYLTPAPVPALSVYALILLMLSLLFVMRRQYNK